MDSLIKDMDAPDDTGQQADSQDTGSHVDGNLFASRQVTPFVCRLRCPSWNTAERFFGFVF